MRAGIYLIKFHKECLYIGKSIDIDRRWKEHTNRLIKGTAAKAMQYAYDRYGMPEFTVLVYSHADHIDLMESIYINNDWDRGALINTTRPGLVPEEDMEILLDNVGALKFSTATHIRNMHDLNETIETNDSEHAEAVELLMEKHILAVSALADPIKSERARYQELLNKDEFVAGITQRIASQEEELNALNNEANRLAAEILRLNKRGFFDRLFNT